jgi:hypothetical protein
MTSGRAAYALNTGVVAVLASRGSCILVGTQRSFAPIPSLWTSRQHMGHSFQKSGRNRANRVPGDVTEKCLAATSGVQTGRKSPASHPVVTVWVWGGGKWAVPEPSWPILTVHDGMERSIADVAPWLGRTRTARFESPAPQP